MKNFFHIPFFRRSQTPPPDPVQRPPSPPPPPPPPQGTVIHGAYFAGVSEIVFDNQNEFNNVGGDLYVDTNQDETENTKVDALQEDFYSESSLSTLTSPLGPNPNWAPGTSISGQYFAGSSGLRFAGDNEFNSMKGTMVKTRRSRKTAGDEGRPEPRVIDPPYKEQSKSPSSSTPDILPLQGVHISGDFFAGVYDSAKFTGTNEFNAVERNLYKTTYNFEQSQSIEEAPKDEVTLCQLR
ncbi:hypothetical protein F5878DRAFT_646295 [Lentinula raphanica]|uniref:Uncharacterized protein n=1 Tax=Lentinula raphanica TaxID=153919 RepID=A0AA38NYL3_9AGAR|nr:hypothetical protein F5878DRAFT_646295 [Lentinula raphanica]